MSRRARRGGLPTAFRAEVPGAGDGPTIAAMAEYDALPGIGHACGHNVIATAGAGPAPRWRWPQRPSPRRAFPTAVASSCWDARRGRRRGQGQAHGGGRVPRRRRRDDDPSASGTQVWRPTLGLMKAKVEYFGKAAHASSWPWRGVNALNAVIGLFNALDAMRQQIRPDARVHGVITLGASSRTSFPSTRRPTSTCARSTRPTSRSCGAASNRGRGRRHRHRPPRRGHRRPDDPRPAEARTSGWRTCSSNNLGVLGIDFPVDPDDGMAAYGSTDAGNVSHAVPTIHPYIGNGALRRSRPLARVRRAQRDAARARGHGGRRQGAGPDRPRSPGQPAGAPGREAASSRCRPRAEKMARAILGGLRLPGAHHHHRDEALEADAHATARRRRPPAGASADPSRAPRMRDSS